MVITWLSEAQNKYQFPLQYRTYFFYSFFFGGQPFTRMKSTTTRSKGEKEKENENENDLSR